MNDCCLTTNEQYFSYFMTRKRYTQRDDDNVRFVLDQHAQLNFSSASSLKHQSTGRHVALLELLRIKPMIPYLIHINVGFKSSLELVLYLFACSTT